jgi:hypothetical protein
LRLLAETLGLKKDKSGDRILATSRRGVADLLFNFAIPRVNEISRNQTVKNIKGNLIPLLVAFASHVDAYEDDTSRCDGCC